MALAKAIIAQGEYQGFGIDTALSYNDAGVIGRGSMAVLGAYLLIEVSGEACCSDPPYPLAGSSDSGGGSYGLVSRGRRVRYSR